LSYEGRTGSFYEKAPDVDPVAEKVAFKYVQKETKKTQANRLSRIIREATGISRGKADDVANALIRSSRDLGTLAYQKNWPVNEKGDIEGPRGSLSFDEARRFL